MEPYYINPFITAAIKLIKQTTGLDVFKRNVYVKKGKASVGGVGIILGISGDVNGRVAYEFSRGMLMKLASRMIKRSQIPFENKDEFLKLLKSAVGELGNLISGRAITYLEETGYNCKITSPRVYTGRGIPLIAKTMVTFIIELETKFGDFIINLALESEPKANPGGTQTNKESDSAELSRDF